MVYSTPVKNLRGVGEAKEKALAKLGIRCAGDILRHYPRAYQNRAAVITAAEGGHDRRTGVACADRRRRAEGCPSSAAACGF